MAGDNKDPILDFMVVRAPERVPETKVRRCYIWDRVRLKPDRGPRERMPVDSGDSQALETVSPIGRIVFDLVFHSDRRESEFLDKLLDELLGTLRPYRAAPAADERADIPDGDGIDPSDPLRLRLDDLAQHAHIIVGDLYYLLPDRLERLAAAGVPLIGTLLEVRPILEAAAHPADSKTPFDRDALLTALEEVFGRPLWQVVFSSEGHSEDYAKAHRALFEALYLLYLLRRWTSVDLSDLIDGLQILHTLDALAIDGLYEAVRSAAVSAEDRALMAVVAATEPGLVGWRDAAGAHGYPTITSAPALAELMDAHPVVNPLLARLWWFRQPFNDVKPIGVGDLKVVKQWLTAYLPGEISHIHNIMKGETRKRLHTRTERSEEVFSLTNSRTDETTKDTTSTERFEVKNEAENVVRATLNVTANANLTYNNAAAMITASAGAGFAYNRATEDHSRTAQNFARDVVTKAVERVQSQTSSQRTITQTFETVEKNGQKFDNIGGHEHISGMYRWLDKEYTAQVYNYGKRMMFEFVIPEPAAFWVKSKLRAYESSLDVPQPPFPVPSEPKVDLDFTKDQITEQLFATLRVRYDLRDVPNYPAASRTGAARDPQSRGRQFAEKDISGSGYSKTFDCVIEGATGYRASGVHVTRYAEFWHKDAANQVRLTLNGRLVHQETSDSYMWPLDWHVVPDEDIVFTSDDVGLGVTFGAEIHFYDIAVEVTLERMPDTLTSWQQLVWDTIVGLERKKLEAAYEEAQMTYQARLSEYRNRLGQIRTVAIHEIIAGRSDAANKLVIDEEIKKHCLTMISKEFDTEDTDDLLADVVTMSDRDVWTESYGLSITEATKAEETTTVGYELEGRTVVFPAIDIEASRSKGSVVQFLEQAFEWERLSYVFYPYFWGAEKDWIELMNREDDTDPTFTAFLRSGMARVLVAATPAYEDAVLYYLDTREAWSGGRSPVIGDPLFVSLHDEMRSQTDDRAGGVPDGDEWTFLVPTSLVYLHGSADKLPDIEAERVAAANANPN